MADNMISLTIDPAKVTELQQAWMIWYATPLEERIPLVRKHDNIAKLLHGNGAFTIFHKKSSIKTSNIIEAAKNKQVLVAQRIKKSTGNPDGGGGFGGIVRQTRRAIPVDIASLIGKSEQEIIEVVMGQDFVRKLCANDDIILKPDAAGVLRIERITDIIQVALRGTQREFGEEVTPEMRAFLDKVVKAGQGFSDDERTKLEYLTRLFDGAKQFRTGARDWYFALHLYNGVGPVYLIDPIGFTKELEAEDFDKLIAHGRQQLEKNIPLFKQSPANLIGQEIMGWDQHSLFDVLKLWGKIGTDYADENSKRDLGHDFRYPHEWLTAGLKLAIDMIGEINNGQSIEQNLLELFTAVQQSIIDDAIAKGNPEEIYNIDIIGAVGEMCGLPPKDISELHEFDAVFGLKAGTFENLHKACQDKVLESGFVPSNLYIDLKDKTRARNMLRLAKNHGTHFVTMTRNGFRTPLDKVNWNSAALPDGSSRRVTSFVSRQWYHAASSTPLEGAIKAAGVTPRPNTAARALKAA